MPQRTSSMAGEAEKVFHSQLYLLYTLDSDGQRRRRSTCWSRSRSRSLCRICRAESNFLALFYLQRSLFFYETRFSLSVPPRKQIGENKSRAKQVAKGKGKVHMPASLWFCCRTFFRSCCWCFLIFLLFFLCLLALAKATFARFDCVKFLWLFDFFTYWPSHESSKGRRVVVGTGRKRRSSVASQAFLVP